MDDEHGARPFRADVLVEGADIVWVREAGSTTDRDAATDRGSTAGRGAAAGRGTAADPDVDTTVVDARDLLLTPGLVNAHTHSWEILLRGTSDPLPLEIWTLLSYPPTGVDPLPERLVYLRTVVAAVESLLGGVTTLLDDTGELPAQTMESIRPLFRAYDDAGIRVTCAATTVDVPMVDRLAFADEVLPADVLARSRAALPPGPEIHAEYFALADAARAEAARYPRIRFSPSPSAPLRVTDDYLLACAAHALEHGEVLHTHLLETVLQQTLARTRYDGRTIVEHLAELGVLGANLTAAHGIWLTDGDIRLLAEHGGTVVHNPLSNLRLGSGILRWRALHEAGVPVALGSDGASSNDSMRLLEVMKAAALLHTQSDPDYRNWPVAAEVLAAATRTGAKAAGWGDRTGVLAAGYAADLVVFDLTATTNFTPLNDAANQLVLAEDGRSIHQVWVDGRLVVEDGACLLVDTRALLAEFRVEAQRYLDERLPAWRALQSSLEPHVRTAYLRAATSTRG